MSGERLLRQPTGFGPGLRWITRAGESDGDTGMDFGILRLSAASATELPGDLEMAVLLLAGDVRLAWSGGERSASRASLFDQEPLAVHLPAGLSLQIESTTGCELAVVRTANDREFAPRTFDGRSMLASEHRGRGTLDETSYRIVRTLFDDRNRPEANLVLGEVVNFPGRWSSYPPHHHPQPEIYHYRFDRPQGYGHGELGDAVYKIRHGDTLKILDAVDHAQVAAPGYALYYLWAIRHLPGARYSVPEFTEEHRWTLEPEARQWAPTAIEPEPER